METLTLNDGTVINGHILENGDGLIIFVYLDNTDMMHGFMLFSNPERTKHIVAFNHGTEKIYDGYTDVWAVSHEFGNCNIIMKRGEE